MLACKIKKMKFKDLWPILSPKSIYALVYNSLNDVIAYNLSVDDLYKELFMHGDKNVKKLEHMEVNRINTIVLFLEMENET